MPPASGSAIDRLADAATARSDATDARVAMIEGRLRDTEIALAEQRGAAGGLQRLAPWIALAVSIAMAIRTFLK